VLKSLEASLLIFAIDYSEPPLSVKLHAPFTDVGKEASNDIILRDPLVSSHHLRFSYEGGWHVSCLSGTGLLFVNGQITDQAELSIGDQLVIGGTVLRLAVPSQPSASLTQNDIDVAPKLIVQCGNLRFAVPLRHETITIGRDPQSGIIIPSPFVGRRHAILHRQPDGQYMIEDLGSQNGLSWHGRRVSTHRLQPQHLLVIGAPSSDQQVTLSYQLPPPITQHIPLNTRSTATVITLGRDTGCTFTLISLLVSRRHAEIQRNADGAITITDLSSTNGTFVNEQRISHSTPLQPGNRVQIGPFRFIYDGTQLQSVGTTSGMRIDATDLVYIGSSGKTLLDHVSLAILPGELVAIAGGSGAGKSTLMKALAGIQHAQSGTVAFDGTDSYAYYDFFRGHIGYLPQANIAHDILTVEKALHYTARLRLASDVTNEEIADRISVVLNTVSLLHRRRNMISTLSGGERRRLNLAQELLAAPPVLFLDEPGSGLDPDMQRDLLNTMRAITAQGQTVVLVTHEIPDIEKCDRLAFMGVGGQLCYFGPPAEACDFFGVNSYEDIYAAVNTPQAALSWRQRFTQSTIFIHEVRKRLIAQPAKRPASTVGLSRARRLSFWSQTGLLSRRYIEILMRDRKNLAILVLQAPIISLVLTMVSPDGVFTEKSGPSPIDAQTVLFFMTITMIWFGTINAIREVCKESDIYLRERLAGLKIWPYLLSKVLVLTGICTVQAVILVLIVTAHTGLPPNSARLYFPPIAELFISIFLAGFAAQALGLCVSAFANTQEIAISAAPLLLIPQLLLAGIIFQLPGPAKIPADAMISRWTVQALGTSVDLNHLYYAQLVILDSTSKSVPNQPPTNQNANKNKFDPASYDSNPKLANYTTSVASGASWADARNSRRSHLLQSWFAISILGVIFIVISAMRLYAKDPR
jgi:ABC transport system ATP-binding/permease protein